MYEDTRSWREGIEPLASRREKDAARPHAER